MYVPPAFAVTDRAVLFDFITCHSFALLVSDVGGEPFATHLPLLLDPAAGPHGTLLGHFARANPHAAALAGRPVMAVFSGPHAYVSPTWYRAEGTVPTWNYAAVHAYGVGELIEDPEDVLRLLAATVSTYEAVMPAPWAFNPGSAQLRKMVAGVVGFRVPVDRLEGKWKLNQNHPQDRRDRVAAELERSADPAGRETAALMRAWPARESG